MPYAHYMRSLCSVLVLLATWTYTPPSASGASPPTSLSSLRLLRLLELKGTVYHVQGIDTDGTRLWVTSVDTANRKGYLHEFSVMTGDFLRVTEIQDGERFHPGGMASDGTSLWIPIA